MRLTTHLLLSCILLCAASTAAALQVGDEAVNSKSGTVISEPVPEQDTFQRGCTSLSQAVSQVRRQYNGQIVDARTVVNGNRETHIIKVLTKDGKVKQVRVAGCNRS